MENTCIINPPRTCGVCLARAKTIMDPARKLPLSRPSLVIAQTHLRACRARQGLTYAS